MDRDTALASAKQDEALVARPVTWSGTAQGLSFCALEQGWLHRHYAANRGSMGYSIASVTEARVAGETVSWEVVDKGVLETEGLRLVALNQTNPSRMPVAASTGQAGQRSGRPGGRR